MLININMGDRVSSPCLKPGVSDAEEIDESENLLDMAVIHDQPGMPLSSCHRPEQLIIVVHRPGAPKRSCCLQETIARKCLILSHILWRSGAMWLTHTA